jgi:prepilin-type N-terminal cleavage/methylation domain-containing protein
MPKFRSSKSGFTLIELMVVLAVIAILITITIVIYGRVIRTARISKRAQDLAEVEKALGLYVSKNNSYPTTSGSYQSECASWGGVAADSVVPGLVPDFIKGFPSDPMMNKAANTSCYVYWSDGTDYKLIDMNVTDMTSDDFADNKNLRDPARDGGSDSCLVDGTTYAAWAVYSPGACDK